MAEQDNTLSTADVDTLNAARTILARLSTAHYKPDAQYGEGLVAAKADTAEHDVFMVLNWADTYLKLGLTTEQLQNRKEASAA